jgi:hypothetical protein
MVKDKINYRARGPRTQLTRQTVQGRANDGGLRIGEMERDGILAHGASYFLNESFMVRGDEYYMAVCNKTGAIAIYNDAQNIFLSPFIDGPIHFHSNPDGTMNIKNISRFGRSFSLLRVPYAFKLLVQELQAMNIQMRVITEDNIDQLLNMSYSDNLKRMVKPDAANLEEVVKEYSTVINRKTRELNFTGKDNNVPVVREKYVEDVKPKPLVEQGKGSMLQQLMLVDKHTLEKQYKKYLLERKLLEEKTGEKQPLILPIQPGNEIYIETQNPDGTISVRPRFPGELNYYFKMLGDYKKYELLIKPEADQLRILNVLAEREKAKELQQPQIESPGYAPGSPAYAPSFSNESPGYAPGSPAYAPSFSNESPGYAPGSPAYAPSFSNESSVTILEEPQVKSSILTIEEPKKEEMEEMEEKEEDKQTNGSGDNIKKIITL